MCWKIFPLKEVKWMIVLQLLAQHIKAKGAVKLPLHWLTLEDCKILNEQYKIYFVLEKDFVLLDMEEEQEGDI